MTNKTKDILTDAFQNLLKMSCEPLFVGISFITQVSPLLLRYFLHYSGISLNIFTDNTSSDDKKKNVYSTIFSALTIANNDPLIKINTGLYNEKL